MAYASGRRLPRGFVVGVAALLLLATVVVLYARTEGRAAVPPVTGEIAYAHQFFQATPGIAGEPGVLASGPLKVNDLDIDRVKVTTGLPPSDPFPDINTAVDESEPAWSPDGKRIAFARSTGVGQSAIWVAQADGTGLVPVTQGGGAVDAGPAWSPDSSRIVFSRAGGGTTVLMTAEVPASGNVGAITQLTDDSTVSASEPTWSADGGLIAYTATDQAGNSHVAAITPGGDARDDLTVGSRDRMPAWARDGRLAFVTRRQNFTGGTLNVRDADGSVVALVTPDAATSDAVDDPAWSPESGTVVYGWREDGIGSIRGIPSSGGATFTVVAANDQMTDVRDPTWRPTADLHLTVTSDPDPLPAGQPGAITATVANGGAATVHSVQVRITISNTFNVIGIPPECTAAVDRELGSIVTCVLGALPAGGSASVVIDGRPSGLTDVVVNATATGDVVDLDPSDNTVAARFDIEGADVAVEATDLSSPVVIDNTAGYLIRAVHNGGDRVLDGVVEVRLPTNVTFDNVTASTGVACAQPQPGLVRCTLPAMGPDSPTSFLIAIQATASTVGEAQGTATITSSRSDPEPTNNTATFVTRVIAPRLAVAKQAPGVAVVAEEFEYELNVRNGGEARVIDAVLTDQIPAAVTLVSVLPGTATCTTTTVAGVTTVSCTLPRLDPPAAGAPDGGSAQVRLRVRGTRPGPVTNTACVRFTSAQPSPPVEGIEAAAPRTFEDCNSVTTRIRAGDLAVTVSTVGTAFVGGPFPATVTVRNAGDATVPAAVRVTLPAIACEKPAGRTCAAVTRDLTLGPLAPGRAVGVPVTLVPVAAGPATITARVLPATFDASAANDTAAATVVVRQPRIVAVPPLGPPGFVTVIRGTDFPPGATVTLRWSAGLTLTAPVVRAGAAGGFEAQLPVARRDNVLGPRLAIATTVGLLFPVSTNFLVVPATVNPPDFVVRS